MSEAEQMTDAELARQLQRELSGCRVRVTKVERLDLTAEDAAAKKAQQAIRDAKPKVQPKLFTVDKIMDERKNGQRVEFLVRCAPPPPRPKPRPTPARP